MYEAAAHLGAQGFFSFRTITLPMLSTPVSIAARLAGSGGVARSMA